MDLDKITMFIANVGFPALMCIIFIVAIKYILDNYCKRIDVQTNAINRQSKDIENMKEDIKELNQRINTSIENNTKAMIELNNTISTWIAVQKEDD